MEKTLTIKHMSNMKVVTFKIKAKLWKKRWYIGNRSDGQLCFDAKSGDKIATSHEINNHLWIEQIHEQLFGKEI